MKKNKSGPAGEAGRKLVIAANRRLQEAAQQLFMAKLELERKNAELKIARQTEHKQKEQLRRELDALKHLAAGRTGHKGPVRAEKTPENKLTRAVAEDLALRYIQLLESYLKTRDLAKDEPLVEDLCAILIAHGVTPKGIISMHLRSMPQLNIIGDMETKRAAFESRMVLLKVMTRYADLLQKKMEA